MKHKLSAVFAELGYTDVEDSVALNEFEDRFEKMKQSDRVAKGKFSKTYKYPTFARHIEALKR